jgi:hypothetical protein
LNHTSNRPLCEVAIASVGTVVHLKGYGMVKVFKIVIPDGDIDDSQSERSCAWSFTGLPQASAGKLMDF